MKHKHAELIHAWADGAEIDVFIKHSLEWVQAEPPAWFDDYEYRIKPRTMMCNGFEVPAPETVAPNCAHYVASPTNHDFMVLDCWEGLELDTLRLSRGLIYLRKEDAIARAKAMLGIDPREHSDHA
jgi:hypothetical protein